MAKRSSKRRRLIVGDARNLMRSAANLEVRAEVFQHRCMLKALEAPEVAYFACFDPYDPFPPFGPGALSSPARAAPGQGVRLDMTMLRKAGSADPSLN